MVVLGVDAHKRTYTAVAVDQLGRKLGERTTGTTSQDRPHNQGPDHLHWRFRDATPARPRHRLSTARQALATLDQAVAEDQLDLQRP